MATMEATANAVLETPTPTEAEPASQITQKTTTKILLTQQQLDSVLSTASSTPALHALLKEVLPSNTYVIHPSDYPEEPVDEALLQRVQALQSTAANLSSLIIKRRQEAIAKLEEEVSAAHADIANVPPPQPVPVPERRVYPSALPVAAVLGKAAERARETRKRAGRVREVLKMLCENVEDRGDISHTIAADWSDTFEDLRQHIPREDGEVSSISPFVTPRSKTRRRVARFAGPMRRLELPR